MNHNQNESLVEIHSFLKEMETKRKEIEQQRESLQFQRNELCTWLFFCFDCLVEKERTQQEKNKTIEQQLILLNQLNQHYV